MALNLYETIATRNGRLAKFFDENYNLAKAVKKMIGLVVNIAEEKRVSADSLDYEVYAPRGSEVIVIRIMTKQQMEEKMKGVRSTGG